ncbi:MAG: D-sedoheptulose 7-phosphate isomerase [Planctomycetes bacterium]|nr:D-sedoheptulose 7-phosphate isomerase [Planctomycetota bacterium]
MNPKDLVETRFAESASLNRATSALLAGDIVSCAETVASIVSSGGKLITAGNGGSAADAQHIVAEFVGRFLVERPGLPAIALTTNPSSLTSIVNDYPPDTLFERQLRAVGNKGDVFVGFSTSGNSKNVVKALEAARELGIRSIAFTGKGGGRMGEIADLTLAVPSTQTPRIQEMHVLILHAVCELVDNILYPQQ